MLVLGCRPCLEFECGEGGFIWRGESSGLPEGVYELLVTTRSGSYRFDCELPEAVPEDGVRSCDSTPVSSEPMDEVAEATVSFEAGKTVFALRVRQPNDTPSQEGELGPERVSIELGVGGVPVFEGDYEPEYVVQSRGDGCGSCVHEVHERAALSP